MDVECNKCNNGIIKNSYGVKKILDARTFKCSKCKNYTEVEYEIKWNDNSCSWEPERHVDCTILIREFLINKKIRIAHGLCYDCGGSWHNSTEAVIGHYSRGERKNQPIPVN